MPSFRRLAIQVGIVGTRMKDIHLITGGAGFIGSHLADALSALDCNVRVLDDLSTGRLDNLHGVADRIELITGSVADSSIVERAMSGVGVVYHLAARASVQLSVEQPMTTHAINVGGSLHVLDAARRLGVRRVVVAASSSAYGASNKEVQSEDDPLEPLSPYAADKLSVEMYAKAYARTYGLETVCLRFFNVFGPRQRDDSPYSGVIALFSAALKAGQRPTIYGDGLQSRDFVFVADAVQALIKAGSATHVSGRIFNIGTGKRTTIVDLLAALNHRYQTNIEPVYAPARAGEVRHSCADIRRARKELGYEPSFTLAEGLARLP
ncbi:MAG: UDP-glucose 4-epimerase-like protein [Gemmatales bacterium]|nr:MAG: UDP-glucose 4-epimerase-like protein [Gemmatales bacterium]